MVEAGQITTITLFKFEGFNAYWMFTQLQLAQKGFSKIKGLKFFKLMGSGGKNGFSKMINPNVYEFLGVWDSEYSANLFFEKSKFYEEFKKRSTEDWTVFMQNKAAHGLWSGINPFKDFHTVQEGPITVITRARIRLKYIRKFWSYVPPISQNLEEQDGLLFSIGIGEYPWLMQATFSIWESEQMMREFAYKSKLHSEVIRMTRETGWYKEELFANFIPFRSEGTWEGSDILKPYLDINVN